MATPSFFPMSTFTSVSHFGFDLLLYTSLVSVLLLVILIRIKGNSSKANKLPSGPPRLPVIGNLHQVIKKPLHRSLHDLSQKHGDLMLLQFGPVPILVISSADIVREIIRNHDIVFSGRATSYVTGKFSYGGTDVVFSPYGELWREMRKLSVAELLSTKRVQMFQSVRDEMVKLLVDTIYASLPGPVDLSKLLRDVSINIIARVVLGAEPGARTEALSRLLQEVQDLTGVVSFSDIYPWMAWLDKLTGLAARSEGTFLELDGLYDKIIEEHLDPERSKAEREDLMDVLLRLQKDQNQSLAASRTFVKPMIMDMLIGGTDTTATTLVWTMTEMLRHPQVMDRAKEEVRKCVQGKLTVEETDLPQLLYLKAIIKETLRLHPPAPLMIPRETMEACKVRSYQIPAKMRVFFNATSISLDPRSWDDPDVFHPERFMNSPIDFKGQHFEFLPFGVGRRICPGLNFATVVLEIVIANIIHRFNWELPQDVTIENVDVEEAFSAAAAKKTPLCLVPKPINL